MRNSVRTGQDRRKLANLDHAIDAAKHRCADHPADRLCMLELDRLAERRELLEEEDTLRKFRRSL